MKTLFILLLLLPLKITLAQFQIEEKTVNVDGNNNGYFITIPYGDKKTITKELKDELKSWKGKITSKGFLFADDCHIKDMGDNTFDVYAKVEDMQKGGVNISVKVTFGGAFLSSSEDPQNFKSIKKILYDFSVNAAKAVVEEEAKAVEKELKSKENELNSIIKIIDKNTKEIEEAKNTISESESAIKKGEEDKLKKGEEIIIVEEKIKAIRAKKEAIK